MSDWSRLTINSTKKIGLQGIIGCASSEENIQLELETQPRFHPRILKGRIGYDDQETNTAGTKRLGVHGATS